VYGNQSCWRDFKILQKFHFGENFLDYPSLLTGSEWSCCRGLGKYFTTQNKASKSIMTSKATETLKELDMSGA
jgi:hypothetical protein